jgi:hypothetical protein
MGDEDAVLRFQQLCSWGFHDMGCEGPRWTYWPLKMKAGHLFKMLGSDYPMMQDLGPEEQNLQQQDASSFGERNIKTETLFCTVCLNSVLQLLVLGYYVVKL